MWIPVKNLFGVAKKRFKPFLEKEKIFKAWEEIVGFGKPIFYKNKILVIKVNNPEAMQDLEQIIQEINKRFKSKVIERVRIIAH